FIAGRRIDEGNVGRLVTLDDAVAGSFDYRAEETAHPAVRAGKPARESSAFDPGRNPACEQRVTIHQLGGFAVDQGHTNHARLPVDPLELARKPGDIEHLAGRE